MKITTNRETKKFYGLRNRSGRLPYTLEYGETRSPYAVAAIELLKKHNRNNGELDKKTMWKDVEEDIAKYIAHGEISDHPKSPWDIRIDDTYWEVRSLIMNRRPCAINFASSTQHTTRTWDAEKILNQKWNEINGYFIADSSEYFTKGTFRWWKVPVEVIRWLYETDSWEHKERTGKFAGRGVVMHQWGVKRPIDNFLVTMEKLFTK
jgi:hypothetical protein